LTYVGGSQGGRQSTQYKRWQGPERPLRTGFAATRRGVRADRMQDEQLDRELVDVCIDAADEDRTVRAVSRSTGSQNSRTIEY
jgi:hypothetical protein